MLPGLEMMACTDLAVPREVMQHVVRVESSFNPYAIGVVGGRLARQPRNLAEAVSTARMLENNGYNFSLGIAQVNRYNLANYGLGSYERAFEVCPNLQAGSRILAECYGRAGGDWGKAFSCYYSGNFSTGFRHGYVQKVFASWQDAAGSPVAAGAIPLAGSVGTNARRARLVSTLESLVLRRIEEARKVEARPPAPGIAQPASQQQVAHAQAQAPGPQPQPQPREPQASPTALAATRPQPVMLQPHGAPPLVAPAPTDTTAGLPATPAMPLQQAAQSQSQSPAQVALANSSPAVGNSPPTGPQHDEAFVF